MAAARLTDSEEQALVGQLAEALERLVDLTACPDMAHLFLRATERPRREHLSKGALFEGEMPAALLRMTKSSRSKYGALAAWRHAVLWWNILEEVADDDFRKALSVVYFTRFESNEPPYAWTKASSAAPGETKYRSFNELDKFAREGCRASIVELQNRRAALSGALPDEARGAFLDVALRKTLKDVLRLEDHDLWTDHRED